MDGFQAPAERPSENDDRCRELGPVKPVGAETEARGAMPGSSRGVQVSRQVEAHGESDVVVVHDRRELQGMERDVLSPIRDQPVIALVAGGDFDVPVLAPSEVRKIVGKGPRIYVIEDSLLEHLRLPSSVALSRGSSARIWQPGITSESDPDDHPVVCPLEGETPQEAFARRFDLSRPRVRKELKRLEALLAFNEHQLENAIQALDKRDEALAARAR
jgi:hypothetical protein